MQGARVPNLLARTLGRESGEVSFTACTVKSAKTLTIPELYSGSVVRCSTRATQDVALLVCWSARFGSRQRLARKRTINFTASNIKGPTLKRVERGLFIRARTLNIT